MVQVDAAGDELAEVTFRLPDGDGSTAAWLVGEFNGWSRTADPMDPDGDGFVLVKQLGLGRRYRFRYLLDGGRWQNDWSADAYVPNEFGGEDSLIDLTGLL